MSAAAPAETFDIVVAGLGPAGLTAALALALPNLRGGPSHGGLRIVGVGQPIGARLDARAVALMNPSLALLTAIGVWPDCAALAQPLTGIRIVDATGRLLRAPETTFRASDLDQPAFGACIATGNLVARLADAARRNPAITLIETPEITAITHTAGHVTLTLAGGRRITAPLLVGADGRASPSRRAAGITASTWTYPQTAVAATFRHARPHDGLSIEFHRPAGPLTTVPLPGDASSLVWVETPPEATRLLALDDAAFAQALRHEMHGVLGALEIASPRAAYPLSGLQAGSLAEHRTVLTGEAAHVMPPIGAQGLNLGLRDIAALHDVLADLPDGADIGGPDVMTRYAQARKTDVWSRLTAVDLLNRSLLSANLPVQALRGAGLHLLAAAPVLRRALMRQGLAGGPADGGGLPRLMRPGR